MLEAEQRLEQQAISEAALTELERERNALAIVESRLPNYLDTNTEDSDEDPDYMPTFPERSHDDETGLSSITVPVGESADSPSRPVAPPPPEVNSRTEVTEPTSLGAILKSLVDQQSRSEAEQARQRESQMLLLDEMRNQQKMISDQVVQQNTAMTQMFTYFSTCMGHLYQHVGIEAPAAIPAQQLHYESLNPRPPSVGFLHAHAGVSSFRLIAPAATGDLSVTAPMSVQQHGISLGQVGQSQTTPSTSSTTVPNALMMECQPESTDKAVTNDTEEDTQSDGVCSPEKNDIVQAEEALCG